MYNSKILLDSISPIGCRLTTFEVTYPRIIMAELNTHRALSRNSASSRAIPIAKIIESVEKNPFIPTYWGKNKSGMQASEEVLSIAACESEWLSARDSAVSHAKKLVDLDIHKQIVNRLLEPFLYVTTIISATSFSNFFKLRCHKDAQPEIQVLANLMKASYAKSIPKEVSVGDWHMPLTEDIDDSTLLEDKFKISAARCARVSYLTHDGVRDLGKDLELYDRLTSRDSEDEPKHLSPLEHVAVAVNQSKRFGNFTGWCQLRKFIHNESGEL